MNVRSLEVRFELSIINHESKHYFIFRVFLLCWKEELI